MMMMMIHRAVILSFATGAAVAMSMTASAGAGDGPIGTYYVTDGDNQQLHAFNRDGTMWSMAAAYSSNEFPIAVSGDIRTMGSANGTAGGLYDLFGTAQGTSYMNTFSGGDVYDATTDGEFNYTVDFTTNEVVMTDRNFENPVVLFSVSERSLGITYDQLNDTLWIAGWSDGTVKQYNRDGVLLSWFTTDLSLQSALAIDVADGSLWLYDRGNAFSDRFVKYSRAGDFRGEYHSGVNGNWLGGEFNVVIPAPAALAVFGLAVVGVSRRRRPCA